MFWHTLFFLFLLNTSVSYSKIHYSDHCSLIIPQTNVSHRAHNLNLPYLQPGTSYRTGGDRIFGSNLSYLSDYHVSFSPSRNIFETVTYGVYKVQAYLNFRLPFGNYSYLGSYDSTSAHSRRRFRRSSRFLKFVLDGFWSEPARRLCMVGSARWQSEKGEPIELECVFKLNYASKNSTILTSMAKGTVESARETSDARYFEPIKIVSFPSLDDYSYNLINGGCPERDDMPKNQSLSLQNKSVCSVLSNQRHVFELQYPADCKNRQNCSPFGGDIAYLPRALVLNGLQCFKMEHKMRFLMKFSNTSALHGTFDSRTALIGEGSWDTQKNQLCIMACRILHAIDSKGDADVGDCSTRLSLRFPAIWTINKTDGIVGQIWTNKTASDPGYFKRITFRSSYVDGMNLPARKYVYTQVRLVENSCFTKKLAKDGNKYPSAYSRDMSFDINVKPLSQRIDWGQVTPISVGDDPYQTYASTISEDEDDSNTFKRMNISYKIRLHSYKSHDQKSSLDSSLSPTGYIEITAEGVYDRETGILCMVGCRELHAETHESDGESLDCEIRVKFQFPPLYSKHTNFVEGFIESKREKTDPLFFEGLNVTSTSFSTLEAKRSIWRMDLEIAMVLISNTLTVIFLVSQIFYVKRHPEKLPFISVVMLAILTLGHLIPLVLNFEALILNSRYQQNVILHGKGWLEVNEISVRLVTIVAFLLLLRLLQLAWTAKQTEENGNTFWKAEKKALLVSFPIYIFGALISLLFNWRKIVNTTWVDSSSFAEGIAIDQQSLVFKYLRSYAGLIHDCYLFPQILFNIFCDSRESALSPTFYFGTTLVRLLPHAYDFYRMHHYIHQDFGGSYIYANHSADFYAIAWDVVIPCGCIALAVIICLQQRFGARCIIPKKLRELQLYEKVPVESN